MTTLDGTHGVEVCDRGHGRWSVWCHECDLPVAHEHEPMTRPNADTYAAEHRGWHARRDAKQRTEDRRPFTFLWCSTCQTVTQSNNVAAHDGHGLTGPYRNHGEASAFGSTGKAWKP